MGPSKTYVLNTVWLTLVALVVVPIASSQDRSVSELDLALAREVATVTNKDDRKFTGRLSGFREGRLTISTATGGGEVGYSFAPEDIKELVLPGEGVASQAIELWERGENNEALPLLTALGRQRLRYLPILTSKQRAPLVALVQAMVIAEDFGGAIGTAGLILPFASGSNEKTVLEDAILRGNLALGFTAESKRLAEEWCAGADPSGGSALGWKVLAQLAFEGGDFDQSLWVALQPVVFSNFLPMAHLEECYAFAVASAHRLDDGSLANRLYRDMRERELAWPQIPGLAAIELHYAHAFAQEVDAHEIPEPDNEFSPEPTEPAADLALPLEKVRKTVTRPGT